MSAVIRLLGASGWGPRGALGLAGLAAIAVHALPVAIGEAPERGAPPPAAAPAEGSALRRPLFDPGRQPWTGQGGREVVLRADPVAPVLVLRGIRLDGLSALALLDDGSGDRTWLAAGEGRGDWRVASIGPDRVTVTQNGQRFEAEFLGRAATLKPTPFPDAPPGLRP